MKKELKLDFVDFWPGFKKENNLFTKLLAQFYDVIISKNPDFLFFSCFGFEHLEYSCPKLFYTAENKATPRNIADYSITFELRRISTHYYFPYFAYNLFFYGGVDELIKTISKQDALQLWTEKTKFCCTVVSNPLGDIRNRFFQTLSNRKEVDSGGRHLNNVGGVIENKYEFITNYKFVFAFENQAYPGYVTEKLADALLSKGVPIYFGDPYISDVFNKKRILCLEDFPSMEEFADYVVALSTDRDRYVSMLCEPVFYNNKLPKFLDQDKLREFLIQSIENSKSITPKSETLRKYLYTFSVSRRKIINRSVFLKKIIPTQFQ